MGIQGTPSRTAESVDATLFTVMKRKWLDDGKQERVRVADGRKLLAIIKEASTEAQEDCRLKRIVQGSARPQDGAPLVEGKSTSRGIPVTPLALSALVRPIAGERLKGVQDGVGGK